MFVGDYMKPVKVRVVSVVKDESGVQTTEHKYSGSLAEKNGKNYVFYDENAESGLEGTKTTLKWDQERVIIIRSGTLDHRQEFFRGYIDKSIYKTPYLKIPLETSTTYLYNYFRDGVWHLEIEYTLAHDGQLYGDMKILIEIEEDITGGH